jgi:hypothetical protein
MLSATPLFQYPELAVLAVLLLVIVLLVVWVPRIVEWLLKPRPPATIQGEDLEKNGK